MFINSYEFLWNFIIRGRLAGVPINNINGITFLWIKVKFSSGFMVNIPKSPPESEMTCTCKFPPSGSVLFERMPADAKTSRV